jgi:hypothetical protein
MPETLQLGGSCSGANTLATVPRMPWPVTHKDYQHWTTWAETHGCATPLAGAAPAPRAELPVAALFLCCLALPISLFLGAGNSA